MSAPIALNAFTRIMDESFDEKRIIAVPTLFQSLYGRPGVAGSKTIFSPNSSIIDIDIVKGNRKIAAFIQRGTSASGRSIDKQKNTKSHEFTSVARKFGLIEEVGDIDSDQLLDRMPGENPFAITTKQERLRMLALNDHIPTHVDRILRRCEIAAKESTLTGEMIAVDGSTTLKYDFFRDADNIIDKTGSEWDTGTPTIIADLDEGCRIVNINGKARPDYTLFGEGAMQAYYNDPTIAARADNRTLSELIRVSINNPVPPRYKHLVDAGAIPQGSLTTDLGYLLWIFTYPEVYEDDAGTSFNFMPTDQVLIGSTTARTDRYFGPSDRLPFTELDRQFMISEFGIDPNISIPMNRNVMNRNHAMPSGMFFFDAERFSNKRISITTQAAPIYAPTQTDAFVTLTDLLV